MPQPSEHSTPNKKNKMKRNYQKKTKNNCFVNFHGPPPLCSPINNSKNKKQKQIIDETK